MGIAYSPPDKVVHYDIDASSSECLRAGLHVAVQKAGWEVDRAVTNGYVYLLTSPQRESLQCKVKIHDTGRFIFPGVYTIDIVFLSADETYQSAPFVIAYGTHPAILYGQPVRRIRAHVTPCQIFTYFPGIMRPGNAVMGGIPYIDPNALAGGEHCADEDNAIKTTQAWWACSDLSTADYIWPLASFRAHWVASSNATLHNAEFLNQADRGPEDRALLRLTPPNKPIQFYYNFGNANHWYPVMMRWMGTEEPMCFDPLIAWNTSHPVKIRGQLWDAFIRMKHVPPESPLLFDDLPWFAYSGNETEGYPPHWYQTTDIATVYLREPGITEIECGHEEEPPPSDLSNYVY